MEPERKIKEALSGDIYDIIGNLGNSFEECWITSNYPAVSDAIFWLSLDKYNLKKISMEEAIELFDTV